MSKAPPGSATMFLDRWVRLLKRSRPRSRPASARRPCLEPLEDRTLLSGSSLAMPSPISPTGTVAGEIATSGETDSYQITVGDSGRLTALTQAVAGTSPPVRLSLLSGDGQLL